MQIDFDSLKSRYKLRISQAGLLMSMLGFFALTACSPAQLEMINDVVEVSAMKDGQTKSEAGFKRVVNSNKIPNATKTINCSGIKKGQTITVSGHTKLSAQCDLTGKSVKFLLDTSNTSLDCQGAKLSQNSTDTNNASAITIRPKTNKAISNITVANCHVQGYGHALHIRQHTNPNSRYLKGVTSTRDNKVFAPYDINIINVSSNDSKNSGIFVGDHSHNVHFSKLLVRASGTVGLYFEFGTQHNRVEDSVFVDNGFRIFKPNREAIALDSSAGNIITGNQFIHNGAGGVLLYRNCFEHANDKTRSNHFKRTQSSKNNIIKNNLFLDEPVGVWVAARQSRNLKGFGCGAYMISDSATTSYHHDSAKDNQIINNRFVNADKSVVVEDDGTLIKYNDFSKAMGQPITIGSKIREQTERGAVKNTKIIGNVFSASKPISEQISITKASQPLTQVIH